MKNEPTTQFDYTAVDEHLAGTPERGESERAEDALKDLLTWLIDPVIKLPKDPSNASRIQATMLTVTRVVTLAWKLRLCGIHELNLKQVGQVAGVSKDQIMRSQRQLDALYPVRIARVAASAPSTEKNFNAREDEAQQ